MTFGEPLVVPSSDDIEPFHELPQHKSNAAPQIDLFQPARAVADEMILSSSPVLYPASSSPAPIPSKAKRKLFQTYAKQQPAPKRPRIFGGFEADEDELETDIVQRNNDANTEGSTHQVVESIHCPNEEARGQSAFNIAGGLTITRTTSPELPPISVLLTSRLNRRTVQIKTCSGQTMTIPTRSRAAPQSYEQIIANRSLAAAGRAKTAYYGIEIHKLVDEANIQRELDAAAAEARKDVEPLESVEPPLPLPVAPGRSSNAHQMWTEKYRAKRFTDLVGDERTHRSVLRWLKGWDQIVFPGNIKSKHRKIHEDYDQEKQHRKILLLTGPPGLGKTTLAHVCAKQAGYGVLEINASDDRSRDVVKGRIKDALGTETVRGIQEPGKPRRAGRPVCVVVDEVDGVVSGSGGSGEGGFMKALIDLVHLDKRTSDGPPAARQKQKGEKFRLMRPLIMICNDVYAPSLRPLRQSGLAEIIHVRKPALDKVITRLKTIFHKESIPCDNDAVRRLCESSWGLGTRKQNSVGGRGAGDGDIRGILVQGEWAAHKFRATESDDVRLTRKWVETHIEQSNASQKGLGRGGIREVVERIFIEGAGLPNLPASLSKDDARMIAESQHQPVGISDLRKRTAISALREMISTCGDHDRLMTDCFTTYPTQIFQDDTLLSKPNECYEWLHFHDKISSRIFAGQEWELNAYLGTSACGFHDLFAALDKGSKGWHEEKVTGDDVDEELHPFAGAKADFAAHEAEKGNRAIISGMQSSFSAPLLRLFSSVDAIATELVPNVARMLAPEVKPVIVGGSGGSASMASVRKEAEKNCIQCAVRVMHELNIEFEKIHVEHEGGGAHSNGGYAFRMEPPLDMLTTYHFNKPIAAGSSMPSSTAAMTSLVPPSAPAPVRYAVRQVLSQELAKEKILQASLARQARVTSPAHAPLSRGDRTKNNPNHENNDWESNKENQLPQSGSKTKTRTQQQPSQMPMIATPMVKKDFFGRPIQPPPRPSSPSSAAAAAPQKSQHVRNHSRTQSTTVVPNTNGAIDDFAASTTTTTTTRTWVSFHEGYSNAVRKFISMAEFMDGF